LAPPICDSQVSALQFSDGLANRGAPLGRVNRATGEGDKPSALAAQLVRHSTEFDDGASKPRPTSAARLSRL